MRVAKSMNRALRRKGNVISGRYHVHPLRTPREVRHAIAYVRLQRPQAPAPSRRGGIRGLQLLGRKVVRLLESRPIDTGRKGAHSVAALNVAAFYGVEAVAAPTRRASANLHRPRGTRGGGTRGGGRATCGAQRHRRAGGEPGPVDGGPRQHPRKLALEVGGRTVVIAPHGR